MPHNDAAADRPRRVNNACTADKPDSNSADLPYHGLLRRQFVKLPTLSPDVFSITGTACSVQQQQHLQQLMMPTLILPPMVRAMSEQ